MPSEQVETLVFPSYFLYLRLYGPCEWRYAPGQSQSSCGEATFKKGVIDPLGGREPQRWALHGAPGFCLFGEILLKI